MKKYEISRMLTVSTAHITLADNKKLSPKNPSSVISIDQGFGYLISIRDYTKKELAGYSAAFRKLLKIAAEQDCAWLSIDRDGPVHKHLKTFKW
jgi:hypothetical protein